VRPLADSIQCRPLHLHRRVQRDALSGESESRRGTNYVRGRQNIRCVSLFRRSNHNKQIIQMIDESGTRTRVTQYGRLNTTSHQTIINALAHRAERFQSAGNLSLNNLLTGTLIDETGTVDTSKILDVINEREQIALSEQQERDYVRNYDTVDKVFRIHRSAPAKKEDEIIRLAYENANGFQNRLKNNEKVDKAKRLHNDLEVDIAAYNEHRLNMCHKANVNGFNQLFRGKEAEVRSAVAHNIHENVSKVQEGGTCLLMFGPIIEKLDVGQPSKDDSGLGRWLVMTLRRDEGKTRIICGYNLCFSKATAMSTSYQQQKRYLQLHKKDADSCP
jgi:hypothetical protein